MLEVIKPVATEATSTMKELEATAQNLSHITDENSELNQALTQFKTFGEHLVDLTAPDGSLTQSLDNIRRSLNRLTKNNNLEVTLQNFRASSEELKSTLHDLEPVGRNITEFSETIKRATVALDLARHKKISAIHRLLRRLKAQSRFKAKAAKARASATPSSGVRRLFRQLAWRNFNTALSLS